MKKCIECDLKLSEVELEHKNFHFSHKLLVCMNDECLLSGLYQIGKVDAKLKERS